MRNRGNNELAPSKELLNKWKSGGIVREEYREITLEEMENPESQSRLRRMAEKVSEVKDYQLNCYDKGKHCHRHILK